jgi:hypothetical protein
VSLPSVTITGADADVSPDAMARLSRQWPRLEWGILCSRSRAGTPRYPPLEWVRAARGLLTLQGLPMAAHFCGAYARAIMGLGGGMLPAELPHELSPTSFRRIQINGYEPGRAMWLPLVRQGDFEYVLQARDEATIVACAADAAFHVPACSILFDPSGGAGARPPKWPAAPAGVRTGYAGGIGPNNVAAVLEELREASGGAWPAWIDMESGVRDAQDRLDLAAVLEVLETVERVCAGGDP